jgi:hypothetical protein
MYIPPTFLPYTFKAEKKHINDIAQNAIYLEKETTFSIG